MAKQIGALKITGTFGGICFYCLDGVYYARGKSSLSAERVKHDPAFAKTMRNATQMGNASKIASVIYRQIVPQHERSRERYREIVRMVMKELKENVGGANMLQVISMLLDIPDGVCQISVKMKGTNDSAYNPATTSSASPKLNVIPAPPNPFRTYTAASGEKNNSVSPFVSFG